MAARDETFYTDRMAALIAWMSIIRVGEFVKGLRPPEAAALRAALDELVTANTVLSKRSRPLSAPTIT
jgi:hypothetical protein